MCPRIKIYVLEDVLNGMAMKGLYIEAGVWVQLRLYLEANT